MKSCSKCGEDKSADQFYASIPTRCRACVRAYQKEYSARPEVAAKRRTADYADYHRKYREENPTKRAATQARWQSKSEVKNRRADIQRARSVKIASDLPIDAYSFIIESYGACLRCRSVDDLQIDHVVPLARGGEHSLRNLQVLCRTCNTSKGARSSADYREFVIIATPQELGVV